MAARRRLIIDTDPGVDDAIAILMALAAPEVEVVGLTTVGGNVSLAQGTRNALSLLEFTGAGQVPVSRGASRPRRGKYLYSHEFHGRTGLTRQMPAPSILASEEPAVEFIAGRLEESPGEVDLAALGPLTNLARLHRRYPGALAKGRSVTVMGGAVGVPGNVTPHAEFNFYSDPVAAQEVLETGVPMTLVDLGACRQVWISREDAAASQGEGPLGRLAAEILQGWFEQGSRRERFEFYDPLTLAVCLHHDIVGIRPVTLEVDTAEGSRWGESRATGEGGPVSVADVVDAPRFFALLERLLGLGAG